MPERVTSSRLRHLRRRPVDRRVRNVVEVDMSVAAAEGIGAREHRSHFAFMHVLLLLGGDEFERVESVGKVFGSVLHKPDMRLVNQLIERSFEHVVAGNDCHAVMPVAFPAQSVRRYVGLSPVRTKRSLPTLAKPVTGH